MNDQGMIRFIPQVTDVNNLEPDRSKDFRSQSLQTTNPLNAQPLSRSLNCAWY